MSSHRQFIRFIKKASVYSIVFGFALGGIVFPSTSPDLAHAQTISSCPLDISLVIDHTLTMGLSASGPGPGTPTRMDKVQEALHATYNYFEGVNQGITDNNLKVQIGYASFAYRGTVQRQLTSDMNQLRSVGTQLSRWTNLGEGIAKGREILERQASSVRKQNPNYKKIELVLSDGAVNTFTPLVGQPPQDTAYEPGNRLHPEGINSNRPDDYTRSEATKVRNSGAEVYSITYGEPGTETGVGRHPSHLHIMEQIASPNRSYVNLLGTDLTNTLLQIMTNECKSGGTPPPPSGTPCPTDVVFLIDQTLTMDLQVNGKRRIVYAFDALKLATQIFDTRNQGLAEGDKIRSAYMGWAPDVFVTSGPLTTNMAQVRNSLRDQVTGGTDMGRPIKKGHALFNNMSRRRILIMLTDGRGTHVDGVKLQNDDGSAGMPWHTPADTWFHDEAVKARAAGDDIYMIAYGPDSGFAPVHTHMMRNPDVSGPGTGHFFDNPNNGELNPIFQQIAQDPTFCSGPGGGNPPPPPPPPPPGGGPITVNLTGNTPIEIGESSTLTWSYTGNPTRLDLYENGNLIRGNISPNDPNPSQVVTPQTTTTYMIRATDGITTAFDTQVIVVNEIPNRLTFCVVERANPSKAIPFAWVRIPAVSPPQLIKIQPSKPQDYLEAGEDGCTNPEDIDYTVLKANVDYSSLTTADGYDTQLQTWRQRQRVDTVFIYMDVHTGPVYKLTFCAKNKDNPTLGISSAKIDIDDNLLFAGSFLKTGGDGCTDWRLIQYGKLATGRNYPSFTTAQFYKDQGQDWDWKPSEKIVPILMTPLPPTVRLNADKPCVAVSDIVNLTWISSNAQQLFLDANGGAPRQVAGPNGSSSYSLVTTTTFNLTGVGPGGSARSSVTVCVNGAPPGGQTDAIIHQMVLIAKTMLFPTATLIDDVKFTKPLGDTDVPPLFPSFTIPNAEEKAP